MCTTESTEIREKDQLGICLRVSEARVWFRVVGSMAVHWAGWGFVFEQKLTKGAKSSVGLDGPQRQPTAVYGEGLRIANDVTTFD